MGDRRVFRRSAGAPRAWPGGHRLAVSIVVNVEEGAERSIGDGDECNESIYEAVERVDTEPDLCMESHFGYGPRAGWARIRKALRDNGVVVTLNACGRAVARSPWLVAEAVSDGHEVSAHGWRWERHVHMDEEQERLAIDRTVETIAQVVGRPPVGWHTRSATSTNTRRLLVEHGGFLYDSNAYDDDAPYLVDTERGVHVVLPYAFDTNDMRFLNNGGFVFADDFAHYCMAAFDRLYREGASAPRMLNIGLHLRIIGRPARIGGLERLIEHMAGHEGIWFARRDEIAHAWRQACGLDPWQPREPVGAWS